MFKKLFMIGCLSVAMLGMSQRAVAGPPPVDAVVTLGAADTCVTNFVPLSQGAYDIDKIVVYNSGGVTCAVAVATSDIGVYTSIASYALAASGGAASWPRRAEVASTTTNNYAYAARDVRFITYKPTNSADVVVFQRIVIR